MYADLKPGRFPVAKGSKKVVDDAVEQQRLGARIANLVAKELLRSLSSPTARGKALRMALITKLASVELGGAPAAEAARLTVQDALLSTAEAAVRLEVSRPYVSMLCDHGKLGEVVMTEGGHRRIRSSAVEAYLSARTNRHEGAMSPREAAAEAGLYNFPDGHYKSVRVPVTLYTGVRPQEHKTP